MGGRGGSSGFKTQYTADGVINLSIPPEKIETTYHRKGGMGSHGYFNREVLEARTDGRGNLTFTYADAEIDKPSAKTNTTSNARFQVQAGAIDGTTFNIDWSKVQSISGQTYSVRSEAKANGLKWDSANKIWKR